LAASLFSDHPKSQHRFRERSLHCRVALKRWGATQEIIMKRLLVTAAALVAIGAPAFAQNDSPSGAPLNDSVKQTATAEEKGLIPAPRRSDFRAYVVRQNVPSYTYSSDIAVGAVLPESGVTYYDVPADYGVTQYRYTVVNTRPVLVEPTTRRVIQVIP